MATDDITDAWALIDDTLACVRLSMFKKTSAPFVVRYFEPDGLKCLVCGEIQKPISSRIKTLSFVFL